MLTRRNLLLSGSALLATAAAPPIRTRPDNLVRREGTRFTIGGRRYRYAGSNMWYAAYLGADAPFGSRDRLRRELDRLQALGVNNLRPTSTRLCCAGSILRSPRSAGAACARSSTSTISGNGPVG
jgi:hypothetical protein